MSASGRWPATVQRVRLRLHLHVGTLSEPEPACRSCELRDAGVWLGFYHDAELCEARRALAAGQPAHYDHN
jgi:hypothetical protein